MEIKVTNKPIKKRRVKVWRRNWRLLFHLHGRYTLKFPDLIKAEIENDNEFNKVSIKCGALKLEIGKTVTELYRSKGRGRMHGNRSCRGSQGSQGYKLSPPTLFYFLNPLSIW